MLLKYISTLLFFHGYAFALPTTPFIKLDPDLRFVLVTDGNGKGHTADMWLSLNDLQEALKYNAETDNHYHLFTRNNPWTSQPLLTGNNDYLASTNFDGSKRTYFIVHGWQDNPNGGVFQHLIPAILAREDSNVIMVDWSIGAETANYGLAVTRTVSSGEHIAQVINWLIETTPTTPAHISLFGHSLGGHIVGIAGRNVNGDIAYINSLDPAWPGWITNSNRLRADDASYTEVIHTNAGLAGYLTPIGHVDFYPNEGVNMAGCTNVDCSHDMCYIYLAESIRSGGFTGTSCTTYWQALSGQCSGSARLQMGGLTPKYGASGIYHLTTNAQAPYSQG